MHQYKIMLFYTEIGYHQYFYVFVADFFLIFSKAKENLFSFTSDSYVGVLDYCIFSQAVRGSLSTSGDHTPNQNNNNNNN